MSSPLTKFCSVCKVRHPIDDFSPGQEQCKTVRNRDGRLKYRNVKMPDDYMKFCKKCDFFGLASENFVKDSSRPDGYFLYCRTCENERKRGNKTPQHYLIGLASEFRKKLIAITFKSVRDQNRSIVRQMVEDFKHEGEPISFVGREWQIDILNDMRPRVVARKPSQIGLTWVMERWIIAVLLKYSEKPYSYTDHMGIERKRFLEGIYSFETKDKASIWSRVRLEKIKEDNALVRDKLSMSKTEAVMLMRFGRTSLHLVGRSNIAGVLTIAADIVVIDEKDRDKNPEISNQIGSRTLESPFMNTQSTKGITRTISTPEVSGAGISLQMENSTYDEWEIDCVKCGTSQVLVYPDCIGNFYEKGEDPPTDKDGQQLMPYWRCQHCHEPIDWSTIGKWSPADPDHYENARWVSRHPKKYNEATGAGTIGKQVPFATASRSASFFLNDRDDPDHNISYLWNHLIGLPFDDISKTLVPDNFQEDPVFKWGYSGEGRYVMGCDHHPSLGGFIVIWKQIEKTVTLVNPEGRWCVVYIEHVKNNMDLWDRTEIVDGENETIKGRIYKLMMEYKIDTCVVDVEPDTNEVEKLIYEFRFGMRVWSDRSGASQETFRFVEQEIDERNQIFTPVCRIFEDKVAAIDYYFNKIRTSDLVFITVPEFNDGTTEKNRRDFMDAHVNLYKGEVATNATAGIREKLASMNIKEVYKKRVARTHDHWVMASKFCCQATRVAVQAKRIAGGIVAPEIRGMGKVPGV